MSNIIEKVQNITNNYICYIYNKHVPNKDTIIEHIYKALPLMVDSSKYVFNKDVINKYIDNISENNFQELLSNINEKYSDRKTFGVYYTPRDVILFILTNCWHNKKCSNHDILEHTIFDPTCGAGEFLLIALEQKLMYAEKIGYISDDDIINILATIYGNDIMIESVEITRIRLFFYIIKHIKSVKRYIEVAHILRKNIYNIDFISDDINKKFDIIVGNPPYVEDNKSLSSGRIKYGNIYANVIENSINSLHRQGVIGFIIPLSYISTPRMAKIRHFVENATSKQIIYNYADRPSCLFPKVHQKLSILIAQAGDLPHEVWTANYKYWYKTERDKLFENSTVFRNTLINDVFYPKIGNSIENSIYNKVLSDGIHNIFNLTVKKSEFPIYLNMRACFWIKAFSFKQLSNEYKEFYFQQDVRDFVLCILNSSLFFLYWNIVSDCWHITRKDLYFFKIPLDNISYNFFRKKREQLEHNLELTKQYIDSKQVQYEYKHRMSKHIIDSIDKELGRLYGLSAEEISYIQKYAEKYRLSLSDVQ